MAVSVRGSFGPVVTSLEGLAKEDEKLARSVAPVLRLDAREPSRTRAQPS